MYIVCTMGLLLFQHFRSPHTLEVVKRAVDSVDTGYLDGVVVDYYDEGGEWFGRWFVCY
ncbi:MAG: hypothetical protein MIO93_12835 [ANME-2 cluster archaeon]|nr:hypothetical protein [ANME-2 cluster archaeon]